MGHCGFAALHTARGGQLGRLPTTRGAAGHRSSNSRSRPLLLLLLFEALLRARRLDWEVFVRIVVLHKRIIVVPGGGGKGRGKGLAQRVRAEDGRGDGE
jgi:hypothetical protein